MISLFIHFRLLDLIDILLVSIIFYEIYNLVKGTVAFNIFMGIFFIFVVWLVVRALKMELLGSILGQLFGVGIIAIIIVFQQEVRRFLLMLGGRYRSNRKFSFENLFSSQFKFASEASLQGQRGFREYGVPNTAASVAEGFSLRTTTSSARTSRSTR
jgi:DNA integrity scanning protein DisA with diadenylate cyclase activity